MSSTRPQHFRLSTFAWFVFFAVKAQYTSTNTAAFRFNKKPLETMNRLFSCILGFLIQ